MAWPLSQDYNEAIQSPTSNFADSDLRQGEAITNALGLPTPCSGNFADVYAVVAGQRKWAVKCFTRQIPGLRERYVEISKYLQQVRLPFMVDFRFLDQGIRVRGQWYPILKMEWVEGMPLNEFVENHLDNPTVMQAISTIWLNMAARLGEANLAHGDLQHGNVLLVPGAKAGSVGLKLVDYDGMCVPSLELLKSMEVGHPAYQHPQRLREGVYGLQMDRFSQLVVYTALRALEVGGRGLWERFENGDNLLFSQKDFEAPRDSAVFKELLALNNPEVRKLTAALAQAACLPMAQTPPLQELLPAPTPSRTAAPTRSDSKTQVVSSATGIRGGKKRGGNRLVVATLLACLVMAGIGIGAFVILSQNASPTEKQALVATKPTEKRSAQPSHPTEKDSTRRSNPVTNQTPVVSNGTLVLEIEPKEAEVVLDGKQVGNGGQKEITIDLPQGPHDLRVSKEGFKFFTTKIEAIAGKAQRIKIALEPIEVPQPPANIALFPPWNVKSQRALAAEKKYAFALKLTKDALVAELHAAIKDAEERGDLDDAKQIREAVGKVRPEIPNNRQGIGTHHLFQFGQRVTWYQAKAICESMGGYLACIGDKEKNALIQKMTGGRAWIGGYAIDGHKNWHWVTGQPFTFSHWATGLPAKGTGSKLVFGGVVKGWVNLDAGERPSGFWCEWDEKDYQHPAYLSWDCKSKQAQTAKTKYLVALRSAKQRLIAELNESLEEANRVGQRDDAEKLRELIARHYRAVPTDRVKYGNSYYKRIDERVSWHRAKEICESMGGTLASIKDAKEWEFVSKLMPPGKDDQVLWLGASNEENEGTWKWVDGTPFTFSAWGKGQPDNFGGIEHFLTMTNWGWNDDSDLHACWFVCKWEE